MDEERLTILRLLEEKKITAEEAADLLRAVEPAERGGPAGVSAAAVHQENGDDRGRVGTWAGRRLGRAGLQAGAGAEQLRATGGRLVDRFGGLVGFGVGFRFDETLEGEVSAAEVAVLAVATQNGRVVIRATDEPHKVRIVLHKTVRAASEGEARSRAGVLGRAGVEGDRVVVTGEGGWGWWGAYHLGVELLLPRRLHWSGNVTTSNGRIDVEGITCDGLKISSSNGRIQLVDCRAGDLSAWTSNGRIEARGLSGRAHLRTSNGSLEVEIEPAEGDNALTLETSNGSIAVGGPAERVGWDVDAQTHAGRIHTSVPGVAVGSDGASGWRHAHALGQTSDYGAQPRRVRCEARTSNGSITINAV